MTDQGQAPLPVATLDRERTRRISSGTLDLYVREWGDPEAPAMLLLHGLRGYSGTWRKLASSLADRWHMIAFDARGRGESDWDAERNFTSAMEGNDEELEDKAFVVEFVQLAAPLVKLLFAQIGDRPSSGVGGDE